MNNFDASDKFDSETLFICSQCCISFVVTPPRPTPGISGVNSRFVLTVQTRLLSTASSKLFLANDMICNNETYSPPECKDVSNSPVVYNVACQGPMYFRDILRCVPSNGKL